jgi:hypothetical protein
LVGRKRGERVEKKGGRKGIWKGLQPGFIPTTRTYHRANLAARREIKWSVAAFVLA